MIIVTRTFTRPNVNVPFFVGDKGTVDHHISTVFQGANPTVLSRSMSLSEDRLALTGTMTFVNQAALTALESDAVFSAWHTARSAYNAANGITESFAIIEQ